MGDSESSGPPPFDDPFQGEDVEQRIYGTILQTREPTTASAIADRVECGPKTARKYLDWFADLSVVTRYEGRPTTYERNDAYFEWRHVDRLASEHSIEALREHVRDLTDRIDAYERRYAAEGPEAVDAVGAAEDTDLTIDEVYRDLSEWATARKERERYERARRQRSRGSRDFATG
ncbi:DUF7342 family protein [Halococcoides cellulosivorans]|uniref:Sugar-specific transcriptional regulator TrmB n=1 Tax=Halococcoides cellulosivorans TaxID=1679096 RepID=A0A2R4X1W4_9EURY|nr:sugar-specific transcriptional regulator TrmB [Halococcoides cellulosivorans]AWB27789.1 sugar-specific transcriptional regulator TrmB [Halococcoides cellulosivorans]